MSEISRYSAGRAISSIFLIIGVAYVIAGVIGLVIGISEIGTGAVGAILAGGGLFAIFAGFTTILLCQVAIAIFDIADTGSVGNSAGSVVATSGPVPRKDPPMNAAGVDGTAHALVGRSGKRHSAIERDDGTIVMETLTGKKTFANLEAAQDYIR